VYGGLLASLIDCHATGTAAAALYDLEGRSYDSEPPLRCLTASLQIEYLRPTPIGVELEIQGRIASVEGNRVSVACSILAGQIETVRGTVVAVGVPPSYLAKLAARAGQ
jgi:acyl-coenzyme A thioesterase PaaI-like protein